ncbi:sensor histidine kinase [Rothia uropygialis]|uniref:sensor histidine kinase n=1 Tax=Kocuria sp. 36 TaxID=1415402 RepID=UPI0013EAA793|nr:histidine kinase [Kocuria sp. 36]
MRSKPQFRPLRAVQAGVWLVFVSFTVISLLYQQHSALGLGAGLALIALFCVVYTAGFGYTELLAENRYRLYWCWIALLMLIVAALSLFLGFGVVNLTTFFAAALLFVLPPRLGVACLCFLMAATNLVVLMFADQSGFPYVLSGTLLGPVIVLVVALATHREKVANRLRQDLAVSTERESVARDVHDLLGHSLTVINLKSEVAAKTMESDPAKAREEVLEIARLSRVALADVRSTVTRLRSPDFGGEVDAARKALTTAGIAAHLPDTQAAREVSGVNASLFSWAVREAVTNVVRHSGASRCTVLLTPEKVQITDNGRGISSSYGNGLTGLRERAEQAGGALIIESLVSSEGLLDGEMPGTRVLITMNGDRSPLEIP